MSETNELTIEGRVFEISDIILYQGAIRADVQDSNDDDKYLNKLFVLSESDAESMAESNDELSAFTDETGPDGEHTTNDFDILFEHYFEDANQEVRLEMYKNEIIKAISGAIKENKI